MFVHEVGTGTPIVLLHGFGVDHRILLPLDEAIDSAGNWRRIYFDLPGATQSPIGSLRSARDLVDAATEQIHELIGDQPFAILGNSFGAQLARAIAHEQRPRVLGLACLAGVFEPTHALRNVPPRSVFRGDAGAMALLGEHAPSYAEFAVVQSVENARSFEEWLLPGLLGADQTALETISQDYALATPPEDASPQPFTQPTLILTGRQDQVVGYNDALDRLEHYPRATFATLDEGGHNLHLDKPRLVNPLIIDWLERISHPW